MSANHRRTTTQLRVLGLFGVLAASVMFASDCIMMDSSSSGAEFGSIALGRLRDSPNWRLTLGGIGGPVGACLFVVGFAHVFIALAPGGQRLAWLCAAGFATGYIILGAWHAVGPMLAFILRLLPDDMRNPMAHESGTYFQTLGMVGFLPAFGSLLLLPFLMLFRKTLYPRWFAILTPGVLYLIAMFAFAKLPAPYGGYMVMGSGSLSFLLFFLLSTALLWNAGVQQERS